MKALQVFAVVALLGVVLAGCGGSQTVGGFTTGPMPEDGNFDGVYQSDFGRLEITVNGAFAFGLYEGERHFGRLEGQIDGSLLRFSWTQWDERLGGKTRESKGRGVFKYIIDHEQVADKLKSVHRFEGQWGYNTDETGNRWNGYKLSARSKKRLKRRSPTQIAPTQKTDEDAGEGFIDVK